MTTLSKIKSYIRPLSIPHKTSGSSRVLHAVIVIFCEWPNKNIPNCLLVPYCCVQMNKRGKGPQAVSQSYPAGMTNLLLYWLAWGMQPGSAKLEWVGGAGCTHTGRTGDTIARWRYSWMRKMFITTLLCLPHSWQSPSMIFLERVCSHFFLDARGGTKTACLKQASAVVSLSF